MARLDLNKKEKSLAANPADRFPRQIKKDPPDNKAEAGRAAAGHPAAAAALIPQLISHTGHIGSN